jgi:hypothetical protein
MSGGLPDDAGDFTAVTIAEGARREWRCRSTLM